MNQEKKRERKEVHFWQITIFTETKEMYSKRGKEEEESLKNECHHILWIIKERGERFVFDWMNSGDNCYSRMLLGSSRYRVVVVVRNDKSKGTRKGYRKCVSQHTCACVCVIGINSRIFLYSTFS